MLVVTVTLVERLVTSVVAIVTLVVVSNISSVNNIDSDESTFDRGGKNPDDVFRFHFFAVA